VGEEHKEKNIDHESGLPLGIRRRHMTANRTTAIVVGVLYIIGTAAGILSLVFAGAILESPAPFHEAAAQVANNENRVVIGALCVLTMGFALAMIPAMMHPVLKKQDESLALGYVIFRGGLEAMSYVARECKMLCVTRKSL
jgi:hypothetical protein